MNLEGKWFQVCDDGSFNQKEANIVCQELGFTSGTLFCCSALGQSRLLHNSQYFFAFLLDYWLASLLTVIFYDQLASNLAIISGLCLMLLFLDISIFQESKFV